MSPSRVTTTRGPLAAGRRQGHTRLTGRSEAFSRRCRSKNGVNVPIPGGVRRRPVPRPLLSPTGAQEPDRRRTGWHLFTINTWAVKSEACEAEKIAFCSQRVSGGFCQRFELRWISRRVECLGCIRISRWKTATRSAEIVPGWGVLRFVYRLVNNVYFVYTPRTLIQ